MPKRISFIAAAFAALFTVVAAKADQWDMKTTVTFTEPVEVPGDIVLPAGTYVFKIADVTATRGVIQVFNVEQNHVYATFFAIPEVSVNPIAKPYMGFEERAAGMPVALHEWLYPGAFGGVEFVYR